LAEIFLGDIGALGVKDITVLTCVLDDILENERVCGGKIVVIDFLCFFEYFVLATRVLWDNVHDHLLAAKQWVTNELASAEGDFGHVCDCG